MIERKLLLSNDVFQSVDENLATYWLLFKYLGMALCTINKAILVENSWVVIRVVADVELAVSLMNSLLECKTLALLALLGTVRFLVRWIGFLFIEFAF